jgi:hypothetical protein
VVLHVPPDAAQFVMHRDAGAVEMVGIADAGKLQDMRRADRTGGQDDLARGIDTLGAAVARKLLKNASGNLRKALGEDYRTKSLKSLRYKHG